jgi:hypothetical protein
MSGISHAMAACLAGQRDWRRVTIGNDGAGRFGFARAPLPVYGSINFPNYGAQSILTATSQSSGTNFEIIITGLLPQNVFNDIEVMLANGQSRFFNSLATTGWAQNAGAGNTQWDWSGLPASYTWNIADVGKILGFNVL